MLGFKKEISEKEFKSIINTANQSLMFNTSDPTGSGKDYVEIMPSLTLGGFIELYHDRENNKYRMVVGYTDNNDPVILLLYLLGIVVTFVPDKKKYSKKDEPA